MKWTRALGGGILELLHKEDDNPIIKYSDLDTTPGNLIPPTLIPPLFLAVLGLGAGGLEVGG